MSAGARRGPSHRRGKGAQQGQKTFLEAVQPGRETALRG